MDKRFLRFLMLVAISLLASATTAMAQQTDDDLQAFFDKLASSKPATRSTLPVMPTIVDLSTFSATVRTKTLNIRGGVYARLVNGTLTRSDELKGPVVSIADECYVEMDESVTIAGNNFYYLGYELVNVADGSTFDVDGGVMTLASAASPVVNAPKKKTIIGGSDIGVVLDEQSHFRMTGGDALSVSCNGADAVVTGGSGSLSAPSSLSVGGNAEISVYGLKEGKVNITSALQGYIKIYSNNSNIDNGTVIAEGHGGYYLTESDRENVMYYDASYTRLPTHLSGNQIIVGEKPSTDIDNEDDLQKRLNEIAARGTATEQQPETIVIAAKGCVVKGVTVPEKCHAVITGGPLYIQRGGADYAFMLMGGTLTLKDIVFDVSQSSGIWAAYFAVRNYSKLTIGENVTFAGCKYNLEPALCQLSGSKSDIETFDPAYGSTKDYPAIRYYSGEFLSENAAIQGAGQVFIYGGTIESSDKAIDGDFNCYIEGGTLVGSGSQVINTPSGFVKINDGTVRSGLQSGSNVFIKARNACLYGGSFTGRGLFSTISETLWLDPNRYTTLPHVYLTKNCVMHVLATLGSKSMTLLGEWSNFEFGKTFIHGERIQPVYTLTKTDFSRITFYNMPNDREAYFDADNTVKLRSKQPSNVANDEDDLQRLLDEIAARGKATQWKPDTIIIAEKGIDVSDIEVPSNCHAVIKGGQINLKNSLNSNYNFRLRTSSASLRFMDIKINVSANCTYEGKSIFYVTSGTTVTILSNVAFSGFMQDHSALRLCYLEGGTFDYYSGRFESYNSVIYAKQSGTINMHGGTLYGWLGKPVIDGDANLNLGGGTIQGGGDVVVSAYSITMRGGEINAEREGATYVSTVANCSYGGGKFTGKGTRIEVGTEPYVLPYQYQGTTLPIFYLKNGWCEFFKLGSELNQKTNQKIIFDAKWTEPEKTVIGAKGNFTLTLTDFNLMEFLNLPDGYEAYYEESDHTVRIRKVAEGGETYIATSEDDLQKMLDRIAARGKATAEKPDTIIIAEKGINVKWIYTKENCHAVITGGPLYLQEVSHCNFHVSNRASLKFESIVLDYSRKTFDHCFYVYQNAIVTIGENVTFKGGGNKVGLCDFEGGGTFNYHSGEFVTDAVAVSGSSGFFRMIGGKIESSVTVVDLQSSFVYIDGGIICGHGTMLISAIGGEFYMRGGELKATESGTTFIKTTCGYLIGGKCSGKNANNIMAGVMFVYPEHQGAVQYHIEKSASNILYICGELENLLILKADWAKFELQKSFVIGADGYTLTDDDFNNMTFSNMPDAIRAYYDWDTNSVMLVKAITGEDGDDLQRFFTDLAGKKNKGTVDKPTPVPVCYCGVIVRKDIHVVENINAIIDGKSDESESTDFTFDGGTFTVAEGASLRLKHLDFYGTGTSDSNFRIAGKLFVDENVTLTRFSQFINVEKTGTVVWNNETAVDASSEVIYNNGGIIDIVRGTIPGGIRNAGVVRFGGDDFVGVINQETGGVIYVTKAIESISREVNITINIDAKSIEIDKAIITGSAGYTLTESDMKSIVINLPEGYEWKLVDGSVVITTATGVDMVNADSCTVAEYYDMMGNHIAMPRKGVNIVRYSNGVTKKIVVK